MVKDRRWSKVIGNVLIAMLPLLNCLLNRMVLDPFSAKTAGAKTNRLDEIPVADFNLKS